MRTLPTLPVLLFLPLQALAAEPLPNPTLDEAYIAAPDKSCRRTEADKKTTEGCVSASEKAAQKSLHDAEQQAADPEHAIPGYDPQLLPPPRQLPEQGLTPAQQELMQQIRQIPGQLGR